MQKLSFITLLFFVLHACTPDRLYDAAQGARMNECTKIADGVERVRCYDTATQSYDRYEQGQQPKIKD
jgi:hypothetical protein